jgi:hypothetical protein
MFELGLTLAFVCFGALGCGVSAIALHRRRTRCPTCGSRSLDTYDFIRATEVDNAGKHFPSYWTKHRCATCGAAYVRYNGGGLITKEAFEAGARAPLPPATVVRSAHT